MFVFQSRYKVDFQDFANSCVFYTYENVVRRGHGRGAWEGEMREGDIGDTEWGHGRGYERGHEGTEGGTREEGHGWWGTHICIVGPWVVGGHG